MTIISALSLELVEEILSRVSLTCLGAVRSTCKPWNALCKDQSFAKKHYGALVSMTWNNRDCCWDNSKVFNLYNIKDLPSIKKIGKLLCPVQIFEVYPPCDGLLLCMTMDHKLILWNPFLAQTRRIEVKNAFYYCKYALGYDNNKNHKVLRFRYDNEFKEIEKPKIYNCKSNSWSVLESLRTFHNHISLKGNTYYVERKKLKRFKEDCVLCFNFTTERLGSPMHLPFVTADEDDVFISCIKEEQLALFFQRCRVTYEIEIWITTKIEPDYALWTQLFKLDMKPLCGSGFQPKFVVRSFFIDKKRKVAVVCGACHEMGFYRTCYVVGEDGNFKEIGPIADVFSYVPSLVPILPTH